MLRSVITLWSKKNPMFENYGGQSFLVILTEPKSDWMSISGVLHLGYNNGSRVLTLLAETGAEDGV